MRTKEKGPFHCLCIMAAAELRGVFSRALGDDIVMHLLNKRDGPDAAALYVGLWGTWWLSDAAPSGAKILLGTIPDGTQPAERRMLGELPWTILQLQTIESTHPAWDRIYPVLKAEIETGMQDSTAAKRCSGRVTYESSQEMHRVRSLRHPEALQEYTVIRADAPNATDGTPKPQTVLDRERVPYMVYTGRDPDLRLQPLKLFVERRTPKQQSVGQRLRSETGLTRRSSLLSAVGEWRTWIVLG